MISELFPKTKEIIELLSKLRSATPEYPVDMLVARKAAFLKYAGTITIQGRSPGGEGGQQSGGSGPGSSLGGPTPAQGIVFKALIGFGLVATMLVGSLLLKEPVDVLLDEKIVLTGGESAELLPGSDPILTPLPPILPTEYAPAVIPKMESTPVASTPIVDDVINNITINNNTLSKPNPGLHLGQTPGTPAAPGHGNPGNINKPDKDKPGKPDKPEKPDNQGKPD